MWSDVLKTVFLAIFTAFVAEGMSWLMIYRTERYKKLIIDIERQQQRITQLIESPLPFNPTELMDKIIIKKDLMRVDKEKKLGLQRKASWVARVTIVALLGIFNELFGGWVAARVSFLPLLSCNLEVTHRNFKENDGYQGLTFVCLYFFCIVIWLMRSDIQLLMRSSFRRRLFYTI